MREIKFRAWNKENGLIIKIDSIQFPKKKDKKPFLVGTIVGAEDVDFYNLEDIILEQCTGLKDKNGVLIYEGDIVRNESGQTHTVEYTTELITNCGCCNWVIAYGYDFSDFEYVDETEVIGNIHEGVINE